MSVGSWTTSLHQVGSWKCEEVWESVMSARRHGDKAMSVVHVLAVIVLHTTVLLPFQMPQMLHAAPPVLLTV